jgi:hypothetical protein
MYIKGLKEGTKVTLKPVDMKRFGLTPKNKTDTAQKARRGWFGEGRKS